MARCTYFIVEIRADKTSVRPSVGECVGGCVNGKPLITVCNIEP